MGWKRKAVFEVIKKGSKRTWVQYLFGGQEVFVRLGTQDCINTTLFNATSSGLTAGLAGWNSMKGFANAAVTPLPYAKLLYTTSGVLFGVSSASSVVCLSYGSNSISCIPFAMVGLVANYGGIACGAVAHCSGGGLTAVVAEECVKKVMYGAITAPV